MITPIGHNIIVLGLYGSFQGGYERGSQSGHSIVESEPVVDYAWYEYEPEPYADETIASEDFIPSLATSPPWTWESEAVSEEELPFAIDAIRESAKPLEVNAGDSLDPWWQKEQA